MQLVKVKIEDSLLLYKWFNNKESIKHKIKTKNKISLNNHLIWLKNFIKNNQGIIWLINYDNKNIGNIRLTFIKKNIFEIDIFILKDFRRKKLASTALIKAENNLSKGSVIHSYVKKNNNKSYKFFSSNGYKLFKTTNDVWYLKKQI